MLLPFMVQMHAYTLDHDGGNARQRALFEATLREFVDKASVLDAVTRGARLCARVLTCVRDRVCAHSAALATRVSALTDRLPSRRALTLATDDALYMLAASLSLISVRVVCAVRNT
jgi:hypothetical protein